MSYIVQMVGNKSVAVDDDKAGGIKNQMVSGENDGFFQVGKSLYRIRDIRGVEQMESVDVSKYINKIAEGKAEIAKNLAIYAGQSIRDKTERELKKRVRVATDVFKIDIQPRWHALNEVVRKFFEENPNYPWCPVSVWRDIAFDCIGLGARNVFGPRLLEVMVLHDNAVYEWVQTHDFSQKVVSEDVSSLFDGKL